MKRKRCSVCKNSFIPTGRNQKSCGIYSDKNSCSYEFSKLRRKRYKKLHSEQDGNSIKKRHSFLKSFFEQNPCFDCKMSDMRVLEFDHVRGKKLFNIMSMVNKGLKKWEDILKEIKKCDVVCANCHRIRTVKRANTWRNKKSS
jgi:hypothetical protein